MVSADNLYLDILTEIFSHLSSADLATASLVSKSFNAGANRQLYHTIHFRASNLRKWPAIMSPFSTILSRQELAVHVRSCEITAIPSFKHRLHSDFLQTCIASLSMCPNIHAFTFMVQHPALMQILRAKKQLYKLQLQFENASPSDAEVVSQITGLHTLILHRVPLSLCLRLSRWVSNISDTLHILTINNTRYLTEDLLLEISKKLSSHLRSFHINNCSSIPFGYVLRAASHLPLLESLGFSVGMFISNLNHDFPKLNLPNLHHVILDVHSDLSNFKPNLSFLLVLFFQSISDSPIYSITCKFSNYISFPDQAVSTIIQNFKSTVTTFNLVQADVSHKALTNLAQSCKNLRQLTLTPLRFGDISFFAHTLGLSASLHTIIILSERDSTTIQNSNVSSVLPGWAASDIRELFHCIPNVQKVFTHHRCWTRERTSTDGEDVAIKVTSTKLML